MPRPTRNTADAVKAVKLDRLVAAVIEDEESPKAVLLRLAFILFLELIHELIRPCIAVAYLDIVLWYALLLPESQTRFLCWAYHEHRAIVALKMMV
jgi:hypothetical protein